MMHREAFLSKIQSSDYMYLSSVTTSLLYPQLPPDSNSRSLVATTDAPFSAASSIHQEFSPIPRLTRLNFCANPPPIKLPSLRVFDQGVNALARPYGSAPFQPSPSSFPRPRYRPIAPKPITSTVVVPVHKTAFPKHANIGNSYSSRIDGSPGPRSNKKEECVNRKGRYTTEEGDFIIYFWHDMELNWQEIKTRFAEEFGPSRRRTVQSLQSQYYRMNDRIPLWDNDGWLIFEKEDDVQPTYTSIKCRERERQCRTLDSLGLGQRYPERAIGYSWVDDESKRKWRGWATKRTVQLHGRAERQRIREQGEKK